MQPIPRHWATLRETHTFPGTGTFTLSIHGSSDHSVEEAQRDARTRMDRLVAAGGPVRRRAGGRGAHDGRDHEYYPDRRLAEELLDELHAPGGTLLAAISRNRYGAAVLNTDALLISDVDLPPERRGLLTRLFGRRPAGAGAEDAALATIRRFTAAHPELGVRVYRTRGGFRLLVSGAEAAPTGDRARQLMEELRSDELYMRLCRVHDCYRARLTPKPWRIGMDRFAHLGTRTAADDTHRDWVDRYRAASQEVAVCRLVEVTGPVPSAAEQQIIALHDRATRPESGLPLA